MRRQAEVHRDDRGLEAAQLRDRASRDRRPPRSRSCRMPSASAFAAPDRPRRSAAACVSRPSGGLLERLRWALPVPSPGGSSTRTRVPAPSLLSTAMRPAERPRRIADFRTRRCPCRPTLVVSNGLNSRSRMNSALMPDAGVDDLDHGEALRARIATPDAHLPASRVASSAFCTRCPMTCSRRSSCPSACDARRERRARRRVPSRPSPRRPAHDRRELDRAAAFSTGVAPVRSCSMRRFIRATTCATVSSMSRWNSGLSR